MLRNARIRTVALSLSLLALVASGAAAQEKALTGFAIAGADQEFVWAEAVIVGDSVVVSSEAVAKPVAVRFACSKKRNWANLFNKDGLPALAFRTDDW